MRNRRILSAESILTYISPCRVDEGSNRGRFVLMHSSYSWKAKGIIDRECIFIYGGGGGVVRGRCVSSHIPPYWAETKVWLARNLFMSRNPFISKPKSIVSEWFFVLRWPPYSAVSREITRAQKRISWQE